MAASSRTCRSRSGRGRSSGSPGWWEAAAPRWRARSSAPIGLDDGAILFEGAPVSVKGPRHAARLGIAMVPESRKEQGLFMIRPVRENISIVDVKALARLGIVDRRVEGRRTGALATDLDVRASSQEAMVTTLSGGNQQKVLFAKWLFRRPKLLIADEPTRGVDVGAKRQIHELLIGLARDGLAVLLISSEIEEVLGLAHRVLVMRAGRIVGEFEGAAATDEAVMTAAFTAGPGPRAHDRGHREVPPARFPRLRDRLRVPGAVRRAQLRVGLVPEVPERLEHPRPVGGDRPARVRGDAVHHRRRLRPVRRRERQRVRRRRMQGRELRLARRSESSRASPPASGSGS